MILNNKYYINDVEIGFVEVSKETYEHHLEIKKKIWELCMPRIGNKGRMVMFGTGGDMKDSEFKKLFYEPLSFNIIK